MQYEVGRLVTEFPWSVWLEENLVESSKLATAGNDKKIRSDLK
jgi:hypothetical protein